MKKLFLGAALLTFPLIFSSCSKKTTEVVETPPPSGEAPASNPVASTADPATAAVAPGDAAAALPTPPDGNPLFAGLSAEDRAQFEQWFKKYDLKPDAAVMDQDADSDGYTNREEFLGNTNPRDPKSLPGVMETASVKTVNEITVPLILREVRGEQARVERTDTGGEEQLGKGAQPKGLPYRVTSVKREVKADKHGVYTDVSNVTLENTNTKETVVLIRDLPARSSETHAVIVGPNGQEKRVHLDEVVEIPGMPGQQFRVMELRADQVLVEEISTKRALSIPKR